MRYYAALLAEGRAKPRRYGDPLEVIGSALQTGLEIKLRACVSLSDLRNGHHSVWLVSGSSK